MGSSSMLKQMNARMEWTQERRRDSVRDIVQRHVHRRAHGKNGVRDAGWMQRLIRPNSRYQGYAVRPPSPPPPEGTDADAAGADWDRPLDDGDEAPLQPRSPRRTPAGGVAMRRPRDGMTVGVPAEIAGEPRVALVPEGCRELRQAGFVVTVEAGAGAAAGVPDADYAAAGARIAAGPEEALGADVVVKVRPPRRNAELAREEADMLAQGHRCQGRSVLICAFRGVDPGGPMLAQLRDRRVTAFAIDQAPRGGVFDANAATARAAGYAAALEAAARFPRPLSGTPPERPPAHVLLVGSGTAALAAARAAAGLGARTRMAAWRVSDAGKRAAEAVGCEVVQLPGKGLDADTAAIATLCKSSDVVIAAVASPVPVVTERAWRGMAHGAVVVDVGAGQGGDVVYPAGTPPDAEVTVSGGGVVLVRTTSVAGRRTREASEAWSRCCTRFLLHLTPPGDYSSFAIDLTAPAVKESMVQLYSDTEFSSMRPRGPRRWLQRVSTPQHRESVERAEAAEDADEEIEEGGGEFTFGALITLCTPEWHLFSIGCALTILSVPFTLATPHYAGLLTTAIFHHNRGMAYSSIKMMIVTQTVATCLDTGSGVVFSYAQQAVVCRVRGELFDNLIQQENAFFDSTPSGALASRVQVDTVEMAVDLTYMFSATFESSAKIAGISIYMWTCSPSLAYILFGTVPLVTGVTLCCSRYLQYQSMHVQGLQAEANDVASEALAHHSTVNDAGTARFESRRYKKKAENVFDGMMGKLVIAAGTGFAIDNSFLAAHMAILWVGSGLVLGGSLEPGALVVFISYAQIFRESITALLGVVTSLAKTTGSGAQVYALLNRRAAPCARSLPGATSLTSARGEVEVRDVHFSYPSRKDTSILRGASFDVASGQTVALVGASGSGKSTVFSLLKRRYSPDAGSILIDGIAVGMLEPGWMHSHVSIVEQEPPLMSGTVAHNILYPALSAEPDLEERMEADEVLMDYWQGKIQAAAKIANAHEFIEALPQGYATDVGEGGAALSGGQKQRVAIARGMILDPCLLLLDEATSALDTDSERAVTEALRRASHGRTTLVIAQRLSTIKEADKIVVIDNGVVIEQGTHDELMQRPMSDDTVNYRRLQQSWLV